MHSVLDSLANAGPNGLGSGQILIALAFTYGGGVLASLTPCVYPMIPITVGVMGGLQSSKRSWHEVWLRGLIYVAGMSTVYATLGVIAGLTGRIFGSFTNTPTWYFILAAIMNLAALAMMDVIPFDPVTWINHFKHRYCLSKQSTVRQADQTSEGLTLLGTFALGASSGLVAAPCTTPVLTSILAMIAKTQSAGLGLIFMLAFSFGLGTLLLVIAGFTGAMQVLPRSGKWMKHIKLVSGGILLIFAEYLIYQAGAMGGR